MVLDLMATIASSTQNATVSFLVIDSSSAGGLYDRQLHLSEPFAGSVPSLTLTVWVIRAKVDDTQIVYVSSSMAMKQIDLLQGTLDLLVLKTLSAGPMHGYRIASR